MEFRKKVSGLGKYAKIARFFAGDGRADQKVVRIAGRRDVPRFLLQTGFP